MNKTLVFVLVGMFVLSLGFASAVVQPDTTFVVGKVYTPNYQDVVEGANVTVTCNGNVNSNFSLSNGAYGVGFTDSECPLGADVSIYATHPSYGYGEAETSANIDMPNSDVVLGVGNVVLVPEFGVIVGIMTILGAIGVFFVVRKE